MATSERSPRPTHVSDASSPTDGKGVGMAHLTVVPTNFENSDDEQ